MRANQCISSGEFGWQAKPQPLANQSLEIAQIALARKR